jgi:glucosamine 6-phosphate synthetase-like amidotransferase/phosphosugar isomerase protein
VPACRETPHYASDALGRDVDRPRNPAKSVTVD